MNFIDVLIVALCLIFGWIGFRRGILRTILSIVGLFLGGFLASASLPYLQNLLSDYSFLLRPTVNFSFIIFGASLGMFIFGVIGGFLRIVLLPFPFLKAIDSIIGLFLALVTVLAVTLTVANAARVIPNKTIKDAFSSSIVIKEIEIYTPSNLKNYFIKIQESITNSPLPGVFQSLVESRFVVNKVEENIEIPEAIKLSKNSVVRIDGIAQSCSAAMTGTGFIVANERVITNAHVVAGVEEPVISQSNSALQIQGKVIYLDRQKDIAILFVPGLMGDKLTFIGPVTPNELGFVIGYPNGGVLKTIPVSISSEFESLGADIDGEGQVKREVIVFGGEIKPGNSGGPLLNDQGQVLGMVFAADAQNKNTGYALAPQEMVEIISKSNELTNSIQTGECAKAS
jgi:S1-C subfamily serine protease